MSLFLYDSSDYQVTRFICCFRLFFTCRPFSSSTVEAIRLHLKIMSRLGSVTSKVCVGHINIGGYRLFLYITLSHIRPRNGRIFLPEPGFEPRISSPALYHLSYPDSHASSCSNLPLETDATFTRRCGHEGDLNMSWHENQDGSSGRAPG